MAFNWLGLLLILACGRLLVPTASGAGCQPSPSGLIGWWPGDGNASDIVGNHNGTLTGGAITTNIGVVGSAFNFNGTSAYVSIPSTTTALEPTNLTVEAWVNFSSLDSTLSGSGNAGHQYIVFKQNKNTYNFEGFGLGKDRYPNVPNTNGDVFYFNVTRQDTSGGKGAGVTNAEVDSTVLIATNTWYHIVGIRGTNFLQLYVNGVLQGTTNLDFPQNYSNTPVYFGTSGQAYYDGKLAGKLDEVSIYNRALTSNEVVSIYNAGAAGKCKVAPFITNPPASLGVIFSNSAAFSVGVSSTLFTSYQWQFNGTNITGAKTNTYTIAHALATNAGNYTVIVTNAAGAVTSSPPAVLTVNFPPVITNSPVGLTAIVSNNATFTVGVTGDAPLNYRWFFNVTNLLNSTTNSLNLTNVQATNVGNYTVVVTNASGSVTSAPAVLVLAVSPIFTAQPQSLRLTAGNTAIFTATATGTPAPIYQWLLNGSNIVSLNTNVLTLPNVQATNAGYYTVLATNLAGGAFSSPAGLTVLNAPSNPPPGLTISLNAGYARLNVGGTVGLTYGLQSSLDLSNWLGLTNLTLTLPAQLWNDSLPANRPTEYYRLINGAIPLP
jgi:hypothetical protein